MASSTDSRPVSRSEELSVTEQKIAALWEEVLQTNGRVVATDDFFELGGSSIDMVMVLFRIKDECSVELPEDAMFNAPSVRELAAVVHARQVEAHDVTVDDTNLLRLK